MLGEVGGFPLGELVGFKGEAEALDLKSRARDELIACLLWTDLHEQRMIDGIETPWPRAAFDESHRLCALSSSEGVLEVREITDKSMPGGKMSLAAMIAYFKANPHKVAAYVDKNPRFVFFQLGDTSPRGSINTPVTAYRSIATDKSVYPRACLSFITTKLPAISAGSVIQRHYTGFTLDQDTGGAIRAPGRCDVYMGIGDEAGRLAGSIYQEGQLYYLFLKKGQF